MRLLWICALAGCGRFGFDPHAANSGDDAFDAPASVDAPTDSPPIDGPAACAASYTLNVGTTKVRVGNADTWLNAEQDCEVDGGGSHLILIDNFTDQVTIEGFINPESAWIGLSDRKADMTFLQVIGGMPTYALWGAGQPSFPGPGCVMLEPVSRTYIDADCSTLQKYVCACDGIAADQSAY